LQSQVAAWRLQFRAVRREQPLPVKDQVEVEGVDVRVAVKVPGRPKSGERRLQAGEYLLRVRSLPLLCLRRVNVSRACPRRSSECTSGQRSSEGASETGLWASRPSATSWCLTEATDVHPRSSRQQLPQVPRLCTCRCEFLHRRVAHLRATACQMTYITSGAAYRQVARPTSERRALVMPGQSERSIYEGTMGTTQSQDIGSKPNQTDQPVSRNSKPAAAR